MLCVVRQRVRSPGLWRLPAAVCSNGGLQQMHLLQIVFSGSLIIFAGQTKGPFGVFFSQPVSSGWFFIEAKILAIIRSFKTFQNFLQKYSIKFLFNFIILFLIKIKFLNKNQTFSGNIKINQQPSSPNTPSGCPDRVLRRAGGRPRRRRFPLPCAQARSRIY